MHVALKKNRPLRQSKATLLSGRVGEETRYSVTSFQAGQREILAQLPARSTSRLYLSENAIV